MTGDKRTGATATAPQRDLALPALLAAAQDVVVGRRLGEGKGRRYQYHPYEPNKKPRPNAMGKKRKTGQPALNAIRKTKSAPAPSTQERSDQQCPTSWPRRPTIEQPSAPLILPTPAMNFLPKKPDQASLNASIEPLLMQYAHNQLQQQALAWQQAVLLQQLQTIRTLCNQPGLNDRAATTTCVDPALSLLSPVPLSPPGQVSPHNGLGSDLMTCCTPAGQVTPPPFSTESEEESSVSPGAVSLNAFSGGNLADGGAAIAHNTNDEFEKKESALSSRSGLGVGGVDVSMLPMPAPGFYADVDELLVELNQDMKSE